MDFQKSTMKDKTIDYVLRTTWLAVTKMYNEEAANLKAQWQLVLPY